MNEFRREIKEKSLMDSMNYDLREEILASAFVREELLILLGSFSIEEKEIIKVLLKEKKKRNFSLFFLLLYTCIQFRLNENNQ